MHTVHSLKQGTILAAGAYKVLSILGKGSFGITYLVEEISPASPHRGRKVAMKEFFMAEINSRREGATEIEGTGGSVFTNYCNKFKKEAINLKSLDHPNIVKVYDVFEQNNTAYYTMEYIEGENLDDYIARHGRLDEQQTINIAKTLADALYYMHARQMLHLDIKPKNVMISKGGEIQLIDFGLSKQFGSGGQPESSTIGLGTPGYAPLEQASTKLDGEFPATLDIYALGGTIYKMLTGERPPVATDILNTGFPKGKLAGVGVSEEMQKIVMRAMEPKAVNRFDSMFHLSKQLPDNKMSHIKSTSQKAESQTAFESFSIGNEHTARRPGGNNGGGGRGYSSSNNSGGSQPPRTPRPPHLQPQPKKDNKLLIILCAVLAVLVIVLIAVFALINNSGRSELQQEDSNWSDTDYTLEVVDTEVAPEAGSAEEVVEVDREATVASRKVANVNEYGDAEDYFQAVASAYKNGRVMRYSGYFSDSTGEYPIVLDFSLDSSDNAISCKYVNVNYNVTLKMNVRFNDDEMIVYGNAGGSRFTMTFYPDRDGKWSGSAVNGSKHLDATIFV